MNQSEVRIEFDLRPEIAAASVLAVARLFQAMRESTEQQKITVLKALAAIRDDAGGRFFEVLTVGSCVLSAADAQGKVLPDLGVMALRETRLRVSKQRKGSTN